MCAVTCCRRESFCYHNDINGFPKNSIAPVFYFFYTTVIWQQLHLTHKLVPVITYVTAAINLTKVSKR